MVVRLEDVSATSKYLQWIHTFCMGSSYRLIMVGVMALMVFGVGMALYGYQQAIYPVDSALGYLARAESAQTPEQLADFVRAAKRELPESGNPVWSFPTAKNDFALIQRNLDDMLARAISIASLEPYSTEYNTGLYDIHASLRTMQENLVDATPYLYVSFTNIMLSAVWIAVILALFAILRRGRAKFQEEYENQ
jgi:TRAP-type C4-dicarboxylate transport system permease small subunit